MKKIAIVFFLVCGMAAGAIAQEKLWTGEVILGYDQATGNTENTKLSFSAMGNRKTQDNEVTLKGNTLYSASQGVMDAQKWYTMVRYAFSFWQGKWYNLYRVEVDHDRFADIDYRAIPAIGVGYWFSDTAAFKAMLETSLAHEQTSFISDKADTSTLISVWRGFIEGNVYKDSRLSQEAVYYPSLENERVYRIHTETSFTNPVSTRLSLRLTYSVDYNAQPPTGIRYTDTLFTTNIVYEF